MQYEGNPRARVALVAAKYEDLVLEVVETNPFAEGGAPASYLAKFPLGLVSLLLELVRVGERMLTGLETDPGPREGQLRAHRVDRYRHRESYRNLHESSA